MSVGQTFPDIIVLGSGKYQLVTRDAKSWVHFNTGVSNYEDIDRIMTIMGKDISREMAHDGLVVMRRRNQTSGRQNRIEVKGNASNDPDDFDRHRARFMDMPLEEYRKHFEMFRAYGRHRARNHRLMQEAAEKRKKSKLSEEKHDEI